MAYSADSRGRLRLTTGDITRLKIAAFVNATNASLLGGGVTVPFTAPPGLSVWPNAENWGMSSGEARLSGGYRLPATHVIHTVGPMWQGGAAGEH